MVSDKVKGNIFALVTFICMAFMGIFTKMASAAGGEIWVNFLLYIMAAVLVAPLALRHGFEGIKTQQFPKIFCRMLLGLGASYLYLLAIQRIPIVNATLLFNSAPIFIPILATLLLGAHFSRKTWLAIALGFVGIVLLVAFGGLGLSILILLIHVELEWFWFYVPFQQYFLALIYPTATAIISNAASKDSQGEVMGILHSVQAFGFAISPLLAGLFASLSYDMPMTVGGLSILLGGLILTIQHFQKNFYP